MSQIASQILGAITHLESLNVPAPVYTQIGTNGWQYLLVRRNCVRGRPNFVGSIPVSLGEKEKSSGQIVAKSHNDPSYDLVAHMITLMFDNSRLLIKSILNASLALPLDLLTIHEDKREFDDADKEDDHALGNHPKALPAPNGNAFVTKSTRNKGENSQAKFGAEGKKKTAEGKATRKPLQELNANTLFLPLTSTFLKVHDRFF
jgi:hypothetical protein